MHEFEKLKREELEKIIEDFFHDTKIYQIFEIPDKYYLNCFDKLKSKLNKYELNEDKRFVTYGRLSFLKEELTDRLKDKNLKEQNPKWVGKWDNRMGAFIDLYDYIRGNRDISLGSIPEGENIHEVLNKNDEYYNDGYICKQEKDILLEMINEIENFINQKNMKEENNMGLFDNIKNKYNIKVEENIPQFVYGTPDTMINNFEEDNIEDNDSCVFEAFEGGYFGPSSYYYINLIDNNSYEFKYGYSKNGQVIFNASNELFITKHNKEFYDYFIEKLNRMTTNWNNNYVNNQIMDGTQWDLNIKSINKNFSGSNAFPENYDEVIKYLDKTFNVDMYQMSKKYNVKPENNVPYEVYGIPDVDLNLSKYNIDPENNVPQKVYGIPKPEVSLNVENTNTSSNNATNNEEIVKFSIKTNDKKYILIVKRKDEHFGIVSYVNTSELNGTLAGTPFITIPISFYKKLIKQLKTITFDWDNKYIGNNCVDWNLSVESADFNKNIIGEGAYPNNWNEFIDLISKYELLYKKQTSNK